MFYTKQIYISHHRLHTARSEIPYFLANSFTEIYSILKLSASFTFRFQTEVVIFAGTSKEQTMSITHHTQKYTRSPFINNKLRFWHPLHSLLYTNYLLLLSHDNRKVQLKHFKYEKRIILYIRHLNIYITSFLLCF